ncbi:MAG: sugar ABC transporter permease [Spirochaetales bacterium]|nr:sugar ABC transporter permease [Spirochaetales bacterium]
MKTKKQSNVIWILIFLAPAIALFSLFFIYPIGMVVGTSLTDWRNSVGMNFIGLENYIKFFQNANFRTALGNNIIWALSLGIFQIGMATAMACILARRPKGWTVYRTVYFLPSVISGAALSMMWKAIYNAQHGVLNAFLNTIGLSDLAHNWLGEMETALPAVIISQIFYIGYFMVIILASRVGIDDNYYEAAMIDGANVWQQERFITLPLLKPILITTVTLALAYGLRHFEATYLMTTGGPNHATETMGTFLYTKLKASKWAEANAIGTIIIITGGLAISGIRSLLSRNMDVE